MRLLMLVPIGIPHATFVGRSAGPPIYDSVMPELGADLPAHVETNSGSTSRTKASTWDAPESGQPQTR
jgi:hypothetical protein